MDKQFFVDEVKQAERSLYRVARSFLSTDADAADAVQEALTHAWARRDTLRESKYFRTWLTRILINVCKKALRSRRWLVAMAEVPSPRAYPLADLDRSALREAMRSMDAKYRLPLVLFYLDDYSLKEISGMLTLPQGTVKSRLHRAREILRTKLHQEVFDDEA